MSNPPTAFPYGSVARPALESLAALLNAEGIEAEVHSVAARSNALQELAGSSEVARIAAGFGHTLREIVQQPAAWADTALRAAAFAGESFSRQCHEHRFESIALTGSGSSHYAAELAMPSLEGRLALPVRAIPSGDLLAYGARMMPAGPALLISLARSGNSPESVAAVRVVMEEKPGSLFLNVTCNANGKLATAHQGSDRVSTLLLHPRTHDESLVMTSSFTSMALALAGLAHTGRPEPYLSAVETLCDLSRRALPAMANAIAALPLGDIRRALFLGGGCQLGAAREAALKLTEMTAGRIVSMHETFLGLRHGPMAAVDRETLVVALLPPDARPRRYALDLLEELRRKGLGRATLVVDDGVYVDAEDLASLNARLPLPEELAALMGVLTGQLLGFFACLHHGLKPDAPAETGVITRVVEPFPLYH
ncbi:MAG: SIS domain-containing protein [Bryobacterales bacterium]|nr:SIS domain-containing protein [Bryobacterales bacterium]